ncbi:hypothetical protein RchiOBHm_Chr5g0050141 [Rosa chinensis]|uniref:Uncharacterized protein n=1 Tax=Rosa chinensis TaxID=74649 RepID=A0A2P6QF35_ROSCH|nr:hypothetical protein RchiOBHm_Chr5g0050141 [Rosa chinensis]
MFLLHFCWIIVGAWRELSTCHGVLELLSKGADRAAICAKLEIVFLFVLQTCSCSTI